MNKIRVTLMFDAVNEKDEVENRLMFGVVVPDKATAIDIGSITGQAANSISLHLPQFIEDNR